MGKDRTAYQGQCAAWHKQDKGLSAPLSSLLDIRLLCSTLMTAVSGRAQVVPALRPVLSEEKHKVDSMTDAYAEVPEKLRKALQVVIKGCLAPPEVIDVRAEGAEGWDGDPLLHIYIYFENLDFEENWPDPKKRARLHFDVDPILELAGDTRFPMFFYRKKGEPLYERHVPS